MGNEDENSPAGSADYCGMRASCVGCPSCCFGVGVMVRNKESGKLKWNQRRAETRRATHA